MTGSRETVTVTLTEKVSIAMGRDELRLAKAAAGVEGESLSAYVTGAVRARLQESRRLEAAREVLATFGNDEFPTLEEQHALVALWTRPRAPVATTARPPRPRKRTSPRKRT